MQRWLMKSEPSVFGIDDLQKVTKDHWDGIRNYQARNFMREMQVGDMACLYHSSCKQPGITGLMTISRTVYPDFTAWDPQSHYYDPRSSPENPRWLMVEVSFHKRLQSPIYLEELKRIPELQEWPLLKKGNRLSILPIHPDHWRILEAMICERVVS